MFGKPPSAISGFLGGAVEAQAQPVLTNGGMFTVALPEQRHGIA
jgi:hypothetical protein